MSTAVYRSALWVSLSVHDMLLGLHVLILWTRVRARIETNILMPRYVCVPLFLVILQVVTLSHHKHV